MDTECTFVNQQANRRTIVQQRWNPNFLLAPTVYMLSGKEHHTLEMIVLVWYLLRLTPCSVCIYTCTYCTCTMKRETFMVENFRGFMIQFIKQFF